MNPKDIISDNFIEMVWGNADFGEELNKNKRQVVDNALLKISCGYSNGHTAQCIIEELGLISEKTIKLTKLGRTYLYSSFVKDNNF